MDIPPQITMVNNVIHNNAGYGVILVKPEDRTGNKLPPTHTHTHPSVSVCVINKLKDESVVFMSLISHSTHSSVLIRLININTVTHITRLHGAETRDCSFNFYNFWSDVNFVHL